jgi:hypothetical protein
LGSLDDSVMAPAVSMASTMPNTMSLDRSLLSTFLSPGMKSGAG